MKSSTLPLIFKIEQLQRVYIERDRYGKFCWRDVFSTTSHFTRLKSSHIQTHLKHIQYYSSHDQTLQIYRVQQPRLSEILYVVIDAFRKHLDDLYIRNHSVRKRTSRMSILYRYWTLSYYHNLISVEMKIEFVESYVLFTYYCKNSKKTKIWNSCPTLHFLDIIHDEIQQYTSSLNDVSSHNWFWDLRNWSDFRDLAEQLKVFIEKDDDVATNSMQKYIQIIHHEWSALKFTMTHLQKIFPILIL